MIGYYVHHHGRGHLSRATAIAAAMQTETTILSSMARPPEWTGQWVALPHDESDQPLSPDAHGRLHWAPVHSDGLRERMNLISRWIALARPRAVVVDVSVEVAVFVRLHGVPVIMVAVPGRRGDRPHALAFDVSSAIIGAWPPEATGMLEGLSATAQERFHAVGAIARFAPSFDARRSRPPGKKPRVLVLSGAGGDDFSQALAATGQQLVSGWEWSHLGGASGRWSNDPWQAILAADVVVTHAGEGIVAEVAAARRPMILIPQTRPHDEQITTASVLNRSSWPVIVVGRERPADWASLLERANSLDGSAWRTWNDGRGAARAAEIIQRVILEHAVSV